MKPNPGPRVRVAVVNPTALNGKTEEIVKLKSQIALASEISATDYAQKLISKDFSNESYKCLFSKPVPVPDKKLTQDGRPSLSGDAIGTAVLAKVPIRKYRGAIPPVCMNHVESHVALYNFKTVKF